MSELWIAKKANKFGGKSKNPSIKLAREQFLKFPIDQYKMLKLPNI